MSRLSQGLFKAFIALSIIIFLVGMFLLAFAYTAFGWSTVIAWKNVTTNCVVLRAYVDRHNPPQEQQGRNIFEVLSPDNNIYRQAACASMHDAQFYATASSAALAAQAASFIGQGNTSCYIPPVTIAYSQSAGVLAMLAYYNVNTHRNFIILNYTHAEIAEQQDIWRALMISGSVLIGCGVLFGVLVFLWYWFFLRGEHVEHERLPREKKSRWKDESFRDSWDARRPQ
jgi:hypothetical protein